MMLNSSTTHNEKGAKKRPKGSPQIMIFLALVLVPALLIGQFLGVGGASLIGAFVALFALMASMQGPLRTDLKTFALLGPLIGFSAVAPRIVAEVSRPAAFALITALIFLAGLLPLRGSRYSLVSLGMGMGTLFGYGVVLNKPADNWQLLGAAVSGLVVALVLRILLGIGDPTAQTRQRIASVFDSPEPDYGNALDTWLNDRPTRWLGEALASAGRYRLALRAVVALNGQHTKQHPAFEQFTADARNRATAIATVIRAKSATLEDLTALPKVQEEMDDPGSLAAAREAHAALVEAERAVRKRDRTRVSIPDTMRRQLRFAAVSAGLRLRSIQIRHAVRTALAILVVLLISLRLRPGDPLLTTVLMTTFGILQSSWDETLTRARTRILGLLAGGVLVALTLLFVPQSLFLPVALIGLAVGLWYQSALPSLSAGALMVMTVGLNTSLRSLDPIQVLIEFVTLSVISVLIGTVFGFVVIPALRAQTLSERIDEAFITTVRYLRALPQASPDKRVQAFKLFRDAQFSYTQLVPDHEAITETQATTLNQLRLRLEDLANIAEFSLMSLPGDLEELNISQVATMLEHDDGLPVQPSRSGVFAEALILLAEEANDARRSLRDAPVLAKKKGSSFMRPQR